LPYLLDGAGARFGPFACDRDERVLAEKCVVRDRLGCLIDRARAEKAGRCDGTETYT
jgi:hypothetical protein